MPGKYHHFSSLDNVKSTSLLIIRVKSTKFKSTLLGCSKSNFIGYTRRLKKNMATENQVYAGFGIKAWIVHCHVLLPEDNLVIFHGYVKLPLVLKTNPLNHKFWWLNPNSVVHIPIDHHHISVDYNISLNWNNHGSYTRTFTIIPTSSRWCITPSLSPKNDDCWLDIPMKHPMKFLS